jgi:hypothetical protein
LPWTSSERALLARLNWRNTIHIGSGVAAKDPLWIGPHHGRDFAAVLVQNKKSSSGFGQNFPNIQPNGPKQKRVMIRRKGIP